MRGDRYVIPVKAEYKGAVPGLVHDQSSTGATLFIGPISLVNLNNEIKELMLKEKAEIERILSELSAKVHDNIDALRSNSNILRELDFIFAKGKYASSLNAIKPVVRKDRSFDILGGKHPLIDTILEHRKLAKLQSTYLEGLQPLVNAKTGRIHTHFQQTVTVTGRLSSTDPNLQNIPTRTEEGKQIRRIFGPGAGYDYLMSCDYSQVELRILACIAQDKLLLESFRHGQDVHARTASEVFGVPLDEVSSQMRSRAKAVNFGIVYGISDFGLANQLQVSRKEAAGYIESYFARYTGVKKYMEEIVATAREQGYVSTLMGRRRYLPDIRHSNFNLRSFAERTAINTPIQGTAADIMKKAMIDVQRALEAAQLKSHILLQVHDELVLEVTEDEKDTVAALVQEAMENAVQMEIPLLAEVNFGKNWAETK